MTYSGTLAQLTPSVSGIRGFEIEGFFERLPHEGEGFLIIGQALDEKAIGRYVHTSRVVLTERIGDDTIAFRTLNTEYLLKYKQES